MKRIYRAKIIGDRYPTEYHVEASSWGTAANRAVREWQTDKGKGSRTDKLTIVLLRA
jgi:hypothetical protein